MNRLYTADVTAWGGRDGEIKSSDGILDFRVQKPKEMDGQGGAPNPEQLFAAAWSSCFLGALTLVAEHAGVDTAGTNVTVRVSINEEGKRLSLSSEIDVNIPNTTVQEAQELADKAHRVCPYSKATSGNIPVEVRAI